MFLWRHILHSTNGNVHSLAAASRKIDLLIHVIPQLRPSRLQFKLGLIFCIVVVYTLTEFDAYYICKIFIFRTQIHISGHASDLNGMYCQHIEK